MVETLEDRSLLAAVHGLDAHAHVATPIKGAPAARAAALVDDAYEPNDSQSAAKNLGTITTPTTISNLVMADAADWFRFNMSAKGATSSNVTLAFEHAQGDIDLALYNSFGQRLRLSDGVTNSERVSLSGLAAGNYYIKAYGYRGATNPAYSLTVNIGTPTTPPPPTDDAFENNDSFAAASNLGTLPAAQTFSNLVMADGEDWYRFAMNGAGTTSDFVSISFQNALGNLDLELVSSAGSPINVSSSPTSNSEQVSLDGLAAGTYYVHVLGAANPSYSLQIDPGATTTTPPPAGGFQIQLTFSGLTASQQGIFQQAAAKWQSIITGDLPSATYNGVAVDDLLIDASATPIDGQGRVLGQAGPDRFRSGSGLPYHGSMEFDSADMASMQSDGTLLAVIEHEMGHILGIGTIWRTKGLLTGAGTSNPRFIGSQAVAAYNQIFGTSATGVPVENTGGAGTRDSHWSEAVFNNELMTGWVEANNNMPLSLVTVASLADLGYSVNFAMADAYLPPGVAAAIANANTSSGGRSHVTQDATIIALHTDSDWRGTAADAIDTATATIATLQSNPNMTPAGRAALETATDALLANWSSLSQDLNRILRAI